MTFTLKPDDNGIVVVLTNVDESDEAKLKKASAEGFDPTAEPFNKYYAYDPRLGFFVAKEFFDHAEHKGKRLSYGDYMSITSEGEVLDAENAMQAADCLHVAKDAEYDLAFIIDRILGIKMPRTVYDANIALASLNFAVYKLIDAIESGTEEQKKDFHKAIDHAFDVYQKADAILNGSEFSSLLDLNSQINKYRNLSDEAQAKLLQKYHENF